MIILAGLANAGWYWYHYDALGSVIALSKDGSVVVLLLFGLFFSQPPNAGSGG